MKKPEDTATFLKMQQQIAQLLTQNQTAMVKMNSILDDTLSNFDNMNKDVGKLNKGFEKASETIKDKLRANIKGMGKDLKDYVMTPFLAIFSAKTIIDTVSAMVKHQQAVKDLSFRMGEAGKNTDTLNKAMFNVAKETGITVDRALELMTTLKESRVATKDIEALTAASVKYSRITGVAEESAARLTAELYRSGKMGKSATQDILAGMVQVQRTFGMSRAEMEQLNDSLIETTRALGQYGKSADQIKQFTLGVGKLSGAFSEVGVSADKAQKFVDELLDPDKIQDNALLYAKLGISMKDALSGNVDPGLLAGKFKDLGQQLKGMNNVAASQLAKSMGMSLRDLRAMADMPTDKLNKTMGAAGHGAEALTKAYEEQETGVEKAAKLINAAKVGLEEVATKVLYPMIDKLARGLADNKQWIIFAALAAGAIFVIKKLFDTLAVKFGKKLSDEINTAVGGALGMASRKASTVSGMSSKAGGTGVELAARAESNVGAIKDRLNTLNAETTVMREQITLSNKDLSNRRSALESRNKELGDGRLIGEQDRERVMNRKELKRINNVLKEDGGDLAKLNKFQNREAETYIRLMGKEAQQAMHKQLTNQEQITKSARDGTNARIKEVELVKKANAGSLKVYQHEQESLKRKIAGGHALDSERRKYMEIQSIVAKLENEEKDVAEILNREKNTLEEQMRLSASIVRQRTQIEKVNPAAGSGGGALNVSFIHKLSQAIQTSMGKGAAAVHSGMVKAATSLKTALSPKNIAAKARGAASGLAKGMGKLTMIMGLVMTLLGPLMAKFKPVLDKIMVALGPIIEILANALMPIIEAFQPLIMVLVKVLLPPVLKILGFLLQVSGFLIKAMGSLAGVFNKTIGDSLKTFGDSFINAGQSMSASADKVAGAIDRQTNIAELEKVNKRLENKTMDSFERVKLMEQQTALIKAIGPIAKVAGEAGESGAGTVDSAGNPIEISGKGGTSMIQGGRSLTAVEIADETNKNVDKTAQNTAPLAAILTDIYTVLKTNNPMSAAKSTGQATANMRAGMQSTGSVIVGL